MSHFNQAANTWDSNEKVQMMAELALKTKEKLALKNKVDILDVGCGTGLFCFEFVDLAKSITGVDTSEGMLAVFNTKANHNEKYKSFNIDLEKDNLELSFDLIISSMVFHHLESPDDMVLKLSRLLNSGGKMAIVDLCSEDGSFHPDPKKMGVKHFGFSNEQINSWAKKANLKVSISVIAKRMKNQKVYEQFLAIFEK